MTIHHTGLPITIDVPEGTNVETREISLIGDINVNLVNGSIISVRQ